MSQQLNIFDLPAVARSDEPLPTPDRAVTNSNWAESKSNYYLQLMNKIAVSQLPNYVKRHELKRLSDLRSECVNYADE